MRSDAQKGRAPRFGTPAATGAAGCAMAVVALLLPSAFSSPLAGDSLRSGAELARACGLVLSAALIGTALLLRRDPGSPGPSEALDRSEFFVLSAILLLAVLLRAIALDSALWFDEVVTVVQFVRLAPSELLSTYTTTNNHVLYSLVAHVSVAIFGESAWTLRLPAAIFGVASIWALWHLGRQLCPPRERLAACLLLAVSYHHVWFSQNARGYTGLLFFGILGTSLFLRGIRTPSRELWLAYAVVAALGLYTHLSAVFVFASHGLIFGFLLLRGGSSRPRESPYNGASEWWPLLGFGLAALLTLQLYALALPEVVDAFSSQQAGSDGKRVADWTNPLWTVLEIVRGLGLGAGSWLGAALLAAIAAVGFVDMTRRDWVLAALIVLPVGLTLFALLALSFHVWPRYFLSSIGFATLVLVRGCQVVGAALADRWLPDSGVSGNRVAAGLCTLLVLGSLALLPANYRNPKQDFGAARDFIEAERASGEVAVAIGLAIYPVTNYFAPTWQSAESLPELDVIAAAAPGTWVISSFPTYLESIHPEIVERLASEYELVRVFPGTLGDGDVSVYHSSRSQP